MAAKQNFIIGVDTGGTFTDVVVLGDSGEVWTAKASTTPNDFSRGVMCRDPQYVGLDLDRKSTRLNSSH